MLHGHLCTMILCTLKSVKTEQKDWNRMMYTSFLYLILKSPLIITKSPWAVELLSVFQLINWSINQYEIQFHCSSIMHEINKFQQMCIHQFHKPGQYFYFITIPETKQNNFTYKKANTWTSKEKRQSNFNF